MKLNLSHRNFILFLLIFTFFHCWGPLRDEENICKVRNDYGPAYGNCLLLDSYRTDFPAKTTEASNNFLICLALAKIDFERKCGNTSNIKPWWL